MLQQVSTMRNRQDTYPKDSGIINPLIADKFDGWVFFEKGIEEEQGCIVLWHSAVECTGLETHKRLIAITGQRKIYPDVRKQVA